MAMVRTRCCSYRRGASCTRASTRRSCPIGFLACVLAAHYPKRVRAAVLAGTVASVGANYPYLSPKHFLAKHEKWEGWNKYNREHWLADHSGFPHHLVPQNFFEPPPPHHNPNSPASAPHP